MALNKTILQKLNDHTEGKESLKNFLVEIMQFESGTNGWFNEKYEKILEKHFIEEE